MFEPKGKENKPSAAILYKIQYFGVNALIMK